MVIQTNSPELEDWGRLLYSPDCLLEGVEVLLDFDGTSRDRQESFFTSMSFNESVKSVKLTCVVGGEFGVSEVSGVEGGREVRRRGPEKGKGRRRGRE